MRRGGQRSPGGSWGRGGARLHLLLTAALLAACATSPLGRDQLLLFPQDEVNRMGVAAFRELQASTPVSSDREATAYVECVADAVTALPAAGGEAWEITLFRDPQVNAFALPGGKIGIYEGLLRVAQNQHQLATVVAHEVAHVIAQHSNERISTQYATSAGLDLIGAVAGRDTVVKRTLFGLLGVGAQVGVLLPFSRGQESEADLIGLELAAEAGFDPRESVALWRNMMTEGGEGPPEFLSTHPSGETRMRQLQDNMPRALALAEGAARRPDCSR